MEKIVLTPRFIDTMPLGKTVACLKTEGLVIDTVKGPATWRYKRKIRGTNTVYKKTLGTFPALTVADARAQAAAINAHVEAGVDPRAAAIEAAKTEMSVKDAHALYMADVRSGVNKVIKPRSIEDKERLYRNGLMSLEGRTLQSITEADLRAIIRAKLESGAPVRADRIKAEMKVFFSWCVSIEGEDAGVMLKENPTQRLKVKARDPRERFLSETEIKLFLQAVAGEDRIYQRALLMILLTGCRKLEVCHAPMSEFDGGLWTIPKARYKSNAEHITPLTPWMRSLTAVNTPWLVPSTRKDDAPISDDWINKVLVKVRIRMMEIGGGVVEHFIIHDLRRTMRSNTEALGIPENIAEAMLGHTPPKLVRTYNRHDRLVQMREAYTLWENKLVSWAREVGVDEALGAPLGPL